jgi:hypothetical protein
MPRRRRQLDPAIDVLVRERLEANECVQGWHDPRSGRVTVRLIDRDLQRWLREHRLARGGCGRTLEFRQQEGQWVLVDVGGWIS